MPLVNRMLQSAYRGVSQRRGVCGKGGAWLGGVCTWGGAWSRGVSAPWADTPGGVVSAPGGCLVKGVPAPLADIPSPGGRLVLGGLLPAGCLLLQRMVLHPTGMHSC